MSHFLADLHLEAELKVWHERPEMLEHSNDMHRAGELDLIPAHGEADLEYMTGKCPFSPVFRAIITQGHVYFFRC